MPRFRILPYRAGSRGASALAAELGGRVLRLQRSAFTARDHRDIIINWGSTEAIPPTLQRGRILNQPEAIHRATNKLSFFQHLTATGNGGIIPDYWTRREDIPDDAFPIVCRTQLAGHSGAGIVIAGNRGDLVHAPLYVRYVKKQEEYRVHVGRRDGQSIIISIQRKARRHEVPDDQVNWEIRNHQNGFVYVRGGVNPPEAVLAVAQRALQALPEGVDFGAVDVIWNERQGRAYVLEINTAPGLEGQTVTDYATFFRGL